MQTTMPTYVFLIAETVATYEWVLRDLKPPVFIQDQIEKRLKFLKAIDLFEIDANHVTREIRLRSKPPLVDAGHPMLELQKWGLV